MKKDKKKIIYAIISITIVTALVIGSIFILKSINSPTATQTQETVTKETANNLKKSGITKVFTDPVSARAELVKARQQYLDLKDNNGVTDVDALIYQIDHPSK
jgi:hypothetical protein